MLLSGNCKYKLKELDDNSVDSIVTDPPYELGFMGKKWDSSGISYDVDMWKECLRVLKPGGYLLAFGGSRTYHRMTVAIEDAGFEVRDMIEWIYGSGFPKSHNISKAMEGVLGKQGKGFKSAGDDGRKAEFKQDLTKRSDYGYVWKPTNENAKQWEGWGTALKPAHEPICMARKPITENTVAENCLKFGTGGINIDESRILKKEGDRTEYGVTGIERKTGNVFGKQYGTIEFDGRNGRWPSNVILDEEAGKVIDDQSGISKSQGGTNDIIVESKFKQLSYNPQTPFYYYDIGGASRFFYCPKASRKDRDEGLDHLEDKYYAAGNQAKAELKRGNVDFNSNKGKGRNERHNHNQVGVSKNDHPTVKPTDLMLYLIRLVTPKGGTTLDPFMGSGSSGKAAARGGFNFIGIDEDEEYIKIAEARIKYEKENPYNEDTGERIKINKKSNKFW